MSKITALIPARGGSKGVPGKNIKELHGFPLLAYSIEACIECSGIDRVVVSTDSDEIAKIARHYGAEVPFIRPAEYAQDNSTDYDVINHFFDQTEDEEVAYLRPTTPLRDPKKLTEYINFFFENKVSMSGLRSMHELPEPPYKMFRVEDGYCKGFFEDFNGIKDYTNLPRQTFPKSYHPNGYMDISKRHTLKSAGTSFGMKIRPVITEQVTEIDIQHEFNLLNFQLSAENNVLLNSLKEKFGDN
jgi:CMP-N,N'-diacetyllegionaminic acid synthase